MIHLEFSQKAINKAMKVIPTLMMILRKIPIQTLYASLIHKEKKVIFWLIVNQHLKIKYYCTNS